MVRGTESTTARILQSLAEHVDPDTGLNSPLKATFFVSGKDAMYSNGDYRRKDSNFNLSWQGGKVDFRDLLQEQGHYMANHGYYHHQHIPPSDRYPDGVLKGLDGAVKEAGTSPAQNILMMEKDLIKYDNFIPVFRAPYGANLYSSHINSNTGMAPKVRELGYHPVMWDVDPEEWRYVRRRPEGGEQAALNKMLKDICLNNASGLPGKTVLFHDIHDWTADNIEYFITEIEKRGHRFKAPNDPALGLPWFNDDGSPNYPEAFQERRRRAIDGSASVLPGGSNIEEHMKADGQEQLI